MTTFSCVDISLGIRRPDRGRGIRSSAPNAPVRLPARGCPSQPPRKLRAEWDPLGDLTRRAHSHCTSQLQQSVRKLGIVFRYFLCWLVGCSLSLPFPPPLRLSLLLPPLPLPQASSSLLYPSPLPLPLPLCLPPSPPTPLFFL